jgi:hypothetical protein
MQARYDGLLGGLVAEVEWLGRHRRDVLMRDDGWWRSAVLREDGEGKDEEEVEAWPHGPRAVEYRICV